MARFMKGEARNAMLTGVAEGVVACDSAASLTASEILHYVPAHDGTDDIASAVYGYDTA